MSFLAANKLLPLYCEPSSPQLDPTPSKAAHHQYFILCLWQLRSSYPLHCDLLSVNVISQVGLCWIIIVRPHLRHLAWSSKLFSLELDFFSSVPQAGQWYPCGFCLRSWNTISVFSIPKKQPPKTLFPNDIIYNFHAENSSRLSVNLHHYPICSGILHNSPTHSNTLHL